MRISETTLRLLASLGDWDAEDVLAEGNTECSALRLIGVPPGPWDGW